jgi:hypothetical protein
VIRMGFKRRLGSPPVDISQGQISSPADGHP